MFKQTHVSFSRATEIAMQSVSIFISNIHQYSRYLVPAGQVPEHTPDLDVAHGISSMTNCLWFLNTKSALYIVIVKKCKQSGIPMNNMRFHPLKGHGYGIESQYPYPPVTLQTGKIIIEYPP